MNFLGVDYGEKRIGLSFGDELGLAFPIPAATEKRESDRFEHISQVVENRGITDIVVGYPLNMDGSAGEKAREVDRFIGKLRKRFCLPVHRADERLSTYQAEGDLAASGKRLPARSGEIDSRAASVILQDHLDSIIGVPREAGDGPGS